MEDKKLWSYFKKTIRKRDTSCLDDNTMAAYLEGRALWAKKGLIEEHLAACPDCLDKLMGIRSLLAIETEKVPFDLIQKAKDFVGEGSRGSPEGDAFFWGRLFQINKVLAWGIVSLLVFTSCLTGMKFGGEMALSPVMGLFSGQSNSIVDSAMDLFDSQNIGMI